MWYAHGKNSMTLPLTSLCHADSQRPTHHLTHILLERSFQSIPRPKLDIPESLGLAHWVLDEPDGCGLFGGEEVSECILVDFEYEVTYEGCVGRDVGEREFFAWWAAGEGCGSGRASVEREHAQSGSANERWECRVSVSTGRG